MSRCLSTLQELVGRNGLSLLLLSKFKNQVLPSINLLFLFIYLGMIECHVCSWWCKDLDGLVMKLFLNCLVIEFLMNNNTPLCFSSSGRTKPYSRVGEEFINRDGMMKMQKRMLIEIIEYLFYLIVRRNIFYTSSSVKTWIRLLAYFEYQGRV